MTKREKKISLHFQLQNRRETHRVHPLHHELLGLRGEVVGAHVLVLSLEGELAGDAVAVLGHGADLVRGEEDGALDLVLVGA